MTIIKVYILIGLLTYPIVMYTWYRIKYKYKQFYTQGFRNWYLGFIVYVLLWIIAFPILTVDYIKEMNK